MFHTIRGLALATEHSKGVDTDGAAISQRDNHLPVVF